MVKAVYLQDNIVQIITNNEDDLKKLLYSLDVSKLAYSFFNLSVFMSKRHYEVVKSLMH
jgi:hypothetical protein